jgi:putative transposase
MNTPLAPNPYKLHRFPEEIISHCVGLYLRFCLSYGEVGELMAERRVMLTCEAVRYWCRKFGQLYANQLRRRRPGHGDKWHLDEVFLTIHGERHHLWRAVDQDGHVLDILVQSRRNENRAKRLFRKVLKGLTYVPQVIITDKLKSYGAARRGFLRCPAIAPAVGRTPVAARGASRRLHRLRRSSGAYPPCPARPGTPGKRATRAAE